MEKVYYEVLEYDNDVLKNMFFFSSDDILESKDNAEQCYISKVKQTMHSLKENSTLKYQLVLTILKDYKTSRYILNDDNSTLHLFESKILSEAIGRSIEIPEWPVREDHLLKELI